MNKSYTLFTGLVSTVALASNLLLLSNKDVDMRIALFICLLSLTACGRPKNTPAEFKEYYDRFKKVFKVDPSNVEIVFKDSLDNIGGSVVGACYGNDYIEIDKEFWDESSDEGREKLVFHELGHCALGFDHNDAIRPDGCHESMMHSYLDSDSCYRKHNPNNWKE